MRFVFTAQSAVDDARLDATAQSDLLSDLAAWIEDRRELDARVDRRMQPPRFGELGALVGAVEVLVAATPLAKVVFEWLSQRTKDSRVSLVMKKTGGDELVVELDAGEAVSRQMVADIREFFTESSEANAGGTKVSETGSSEAEPGGSKEGNGESGD